MGKKQGKHTVITRTHLQLLSLRYIKPGKQPKFWSFWTLYDALSFLNVFGTVVWTPFKQLLRQWFDQQTEHDCRFQFDM